mmetsp:Transcript_3024/g.4376  ORF Transcript_3024/g.4376 Transcript_3024/m.4376 type:complete len:103 (+) Transcript_3024:432-740(+)
MDVDRFETGRCLVPVMQMVYVLVQKGRVEQTMDCVEPNFCTQDVQEHGPGEFGNGRRDGEQYSLDSSSSSIFCQPNEEYFQHGNSKRYLIEQYERRHRSKYF